jgi:type I restriction-modification system DNA methylase subunit
MHNSQTHLDRREQVNLGSFYTPKEIVDLAYSLLIKNVPHLENWTIFDSSCGYGSFLTTETKAKRR